MSSDTSVASADSPELELGRARWRQAVARVLAKGRSGELPAEPERLLDTPTYEGFAVRPLYTALDAQPEAALPGQWPFIRGGDGTRDVLSGWRVMETFPGPGEAAGEGNATVLSALSDGVSGLVLRVGAGGAPAGDLDRRWRACSWNWCRSCSMPAWTTPPPPTPCWRWWPRSPEDRRSALSIDCGADPLTGALDGTPGPSIEVVTELAARLVDYGGGVRAITVDGPDSAQPRRQRVVGTGRCARRGRGVPAGAHRRRAGCRGRDATDQFPVRRR